MLIFHILLAILALAPLNDARQQKCGTTFAPEGFLDGNYHIIAVENAMKRASQSDAASGLQTREYPSWLPRLSFPVVFHILDDYNDERLSQNMLFLQFDILKTAFAQYGFDFHLQQIYYYKQPVWAVGQQFSDMTRQIRVGGYDTINVYLMDTISTGYPLYLPVDWLGRATVPEWKDHVSLDSIKFWEDGVQIALRYLAGNIYGDQGTEDGGKTLVHEVGHWLGLLHTFRQGCHPDPEHGGDMVADTPAQYEELGRLKDPRLGLCYRPATVQRCPLDLGFLPNLVDNYMDYMPDSCYQSFTPGQVTRMNHWGRYRREHRVLHGMPPGWKEPRAPTVLPNLPYHTDAPTSKAKAEL